MFLMDSLIRSVLLVSHRKLKQWHERKELTRNGLHGVLQTGRIVVAANPKRKHKLCAIGDGCTVKINVNIGTSGTRCDPALELVKAQAALDNGADALMDLSTGGDLVAIRKKILTLDTTVGTVPV